MDAGGIVGTVGQVNTRRPEDKVYDILRSAKKQEWQTIGMTSGAFRCAVEGWSVMVEKKTGQIKVSIKKLGQKNDEFIKSFADDGVNKFSIFYRKLAENLMR